MSLYDLAKLLLFRMDPERAHAIGLKLMRTLGSMRLDDPALRVKTSLGDLANPIGLAGGYDKTGKYLQSIEKLGFGYLVTGTVTRPPWPGHPKPRIVRNIKDSSLVNALGFPNPGVDTFILNVTKQKVRVPIVGSISGQTIPDILECYEKLQPHVSGIELNLSSPNTAKLRDLRQMEPFKELAADMRPRKRKPTYLKIPAYEDEAQFSQVLKIVKLWNELGFEGVTSGNALPVKEQRVAIGTGGLSGPVLLEGTIKATRSIRNVTSANFEINAVGGISSSRDVRTVLAEGATTAQLYTALIFHGPSLINKMLKELVMNP